MRSKLIPCIHFNTNIVPVCKPEFSDYEILEQANQAIKNRYDDILYAYESLVKLDWTPSVMGTSVDFHRLDVKDLKHLEIIAEKNEFRRLYGEGFSLINQYFIFGDTMKKQDLVSSLADKPSSMVVFSTPHCGPCRAMKPKIEKIASEHHVVKINASEDSELAAEFNIDAVPTLVFYQKDQERSRHVGTMSEEEMKKELEVK